MSVPSAENNLRDATKNLTDPMKTELGKVLHVCKTLQQLSLTPKKFFVAFLETSNIDLAIRRQDWGTPTGWDSNLDVLHAIQNLTYKSDPQNPLWRNFILDEAKKCVLDETAPIGQYPGGLFYSLNKITSNFFSKKKIKERDWNLTHKNMPFLYQLLSAKLNQNQKHGVPKTNVEGVEDKAEEDGCDNLDNVDFDHGSSPTVKQGAASCQSDRQLQREQQTASTILN
ncbi:hypothetical protein PCANC_27814 [Puccinia coronata f. sp. avenae]|uniref:Uncharacterized protein n=1 Tax=Puccinia coronata f. sp. avenae TaxID=200324 RepID=A0A2N5RXK5_9BASI|nr:hypothetical protein PCANC_27814 [Puccinia coronata f. sp. avenae]